MLVSIALNLVFALDVNEFKLPVEVSKADSLLFCVVLVVLLDAV